MLVEALKEKEDDEEVKCSDGHLDIKEMLTDRYQPLSKMRKRVVYY